MAKDKEDEYLDWEKKQNSKWSKISKQVKPVHVIGGLLLFFLGNYFVSTGKIQSNFFFGTIIACGGLILFLLFRESNEPKLIPEHILKQIAQDALDKKRRQGIEIPFDARVKVILPGEGIYEQDMVSQTSGIIRRDIGFKVMKKAYAKTGVIGIHPYNGTILGIRWETFGYTGKESKDRMIIPVKLME